MIETTATFRSVRRNRVVGEVLAPRLDDIRFGDREMRFDPSEALVHTANRNCPCASL